MCLSTTGKMYSLIVILLSSIHTSISTLALKDTTDCINVKLPFSVDKWLFDIKNSYLESLLNTKVVENPTIYHADPDKLTKIINILWFDTIKFNTESTDAYYVLYARHFPLIILKFYCALLGEDKIIENFTDIDDEEFYEYLLSHEKEDWDWLSLHNIKRPGTWDTDDSQYVYDVIMEDSVNVDNSTFDYEGIFSHFPDLLYILSKKNLIMP